MRIWPLDNGIALGAAGLLIWHRLVSVYHKTSVTTVPRKPFSTSTLVLGLLIGTCFGFWGHNMMIIRRLEKISIDIVDVYISRTEAEKDQFRKSRSHFKVRFSLCGTFQESLYG
jgi:hypothetical protein